MKKVGGVRHRPPPPTSEEKVLQHLVAGDAGSLHAARVEAKRRLEEDGDEYVVIYHIIHKGRTGDVPFYVAMSPGASARIADLHKGRLYTKIERWQAGSNPLAEDATHGKTQAATRRNRRRNARR